ncbi:MAG: hypothetical protein ACWGOX_11815 [Desulforhopalus sp.]
MKHVPDYLKLKKSDPADYLFYLLCGAISTLVFIIDLNTPQGIAGGIPYITVVLISLWSPHRYFTFFVAFCCTLLTVIGFAYSPDGSTLQQELSNRFLAVFTIWATAFLAYLRKVAEQKREKAVLDREKALQQIKVLKGFLPICSDCKRIRDNDGSWNSIEDYIITHSEANFSHGMCPDCSKSRYPELYE